MNSANTEMSNRTVMLSKILAICLMISLCWVGWVCSSFLITTTLSATTVSAETKQQVLTTKKMQKWTVIMHHYIQKVDKKQIQIWDFTISIWKQQHQTVETGVCHLRDVGGTPSDRLNCSCRKRLVLTLHISLKKYETKDKRREFEQSKSPSRN